MFCLLSPRRGLLQAIEFFAKDIGTAEEIICDVAGDQKSNYLRKVCREIGKH